MQEFLMTLFPDERGKVQGPKRGPCKPEHGIRDRTRNKGIWNNRNMERKKKSYTCAVEFIVSICFSCQQTLNI